VTIATEEMLNTLDHEGMQIKMTLGFHLTPARVAVINNTNNKYGRGCEKKRPLYSLVGGNIK
jgi:hypothetical protein